MFWSYLLRFLLFWWLISMLFKWAGKYINSSKNSAQPPHRETVKKNPDVVHSGTIEDADFEELDGR